MSDAPDHDHAMNRQDEAHPDEGAIHVEHSGRDDSGHNDSRQFAQMRKPSDAEQLINANAGVIVGHARAVQEAVQGNAAPEVIAQHADHIVAAAGNLQVAVEDHREAVKAATEPEVPAPVVPVAPVASVAPVKTTWAWVWDVLGGVGVVAVLWFAWEHCPWLVSHVGHLTH
jgi:hypothetical protein